MQNKLKVLDLFSGIGGFSLGLEAAGPFRTVAFCEQETFCQAVLRKHWPNVPIFDDVRTIPTDGLRGVDVICGGFPCQPWSQAGERRGAEDDRDLWPEMARLVGELRPRWLVGENVRGFVNQPMGLERSLFDLESLGYQAVPFIIPACSVDAPHRRDRVWIIAHSDSQGEPDGTVDERARSGELVADARCLATRTSKEMDGDTAKRSERNFDAANGSEDVADANEQHAQGRKNTRSAEGNRSSMVKHLARCNADRDPREECNAEPRVGGMVNGVPRWLDEPNCGRTASGIKNRVLRLKSLGNAVVPQVVAQIGRAILAADER